MGYLDKEIANIFRINEMMMTESIFKILKDNYIEVTNPKERIHIIMGLIDNYCHELVFHKHKNIDYKAMKEEVINMIEMLLIKK